MAEYKKQNLQNGDILAAENLWLMEDALVYLSSHEPTVATDISLTRPGYAADAETVGLRFNKIENQINQKFGNTAQQMSEEVLPNYWINLCNKRIPLVRQALMAAGWHKSSFLWYSDAHWQSNSFRSPQLLKYLTKKTPINKTNFCGDITMYEDDELDKLSYLWNWRTAIRDVPNHHSVAGNHDDGNAPNGRYNLESIYSYLMGPEEQTTTVHGNGLYYYIDNYVEKTRYIYLDTATHPGAGQNEVGEWNWLEQEVWLEQTLLTTPKGWHIVGLAHWWVSYKSVKMEDGSTQYYALKEWPENSVWALKKFAAYNNRSEPFASCAGYVRFVMGGHTHWDADYIYTDEVTGIKIPVILTASDSMQGRQIYKDAPADKAMDYNSSILEDSDIYESKYGTTTESAVSAVIANYTPALENSYVDIIRFGRGFNRRVYLNCDENKFHEVIPDIEGWTDLPEGNYLNLLATVGYIDFTYVSTSSGGVLKQSNIHDTTGLISASPGDNVYLANVEFFHKEAVKDNRVGVYFYDSNKNYLNESYYGYSIDKSMPEEMAPVLLNNDIVQFTLPKLSKDYAYVRITASNFTESSVVTINDFLGLEGTTPPPEIEEDDNNSGTDNDSNNINDYTLVALIGKFDNLIKTAVSSDGTTLYNNYGYKNNTIYNSETKVEQESKNWDMTGFIAATEGDTIRFHKVKFTAESSDTNNGLSQILFFDDANTLIKGSPIFKRNDNTYDITWSVKRDSSTNDIIELTIPAGYASFKKLRIIAKDITGESIITINEEINLHDDIVEDLSLAPNPDSSNILRSAFLNLNDYTVYDESSSTWQLVEGAVNSLVNNGWGYTPDYRPSTTDGNLKNAPGVDTSGFFSAKYGTIITLKDTIFRNMLYTNDGNGREGLYLYIDNREDKNEDGTKPWDNGERHLNLTPSVLSAQNINDFIPSYYTPIYDKYGDIVQMTIPRSAGQRQHFARLIVDEFTKNSKVEVTYLNHSKEYDFENALYKAQYPGIVNGETITFHNGGRDTPATSDSELSSHLGYNCGRGYVNNAICHVDSPTKCWDLYTPNWSVTGYIPVAEGARVTFALTNIDVLSETEENQLACVQLFDKDFNFIATSGALTTGSSFIGGYDTETGTIIRTLTYDHTTYKNVAYVRITAAKIDETSNIKMTVS